MTVLPEHRRLLSARDRLEVDLLYWPAKLSLRLGRVALALCLLGGLML